jgi:HD-GYP domain-containing protein (c-di-GMP phosphodiesterase class II)
MTRDRPYRERLSVEGAIAEITRGSGVQFDPDVVAVLIKLHESGAL